MKAKTQNILLAPLGWMLHLLAFMPWWWLWLNSDALYFIAYYVLRYRRKVVRKNLVECFPDKSEEELLKLEKKFYHHFADYFFETVKMLHISENDMRKHLEFRNVEFVEDAWKQNQSVMLYAAHYCNWEWLTSISLWIDPELLKGNVFAGQAYHPLENQWFDQFFLHLRDRFTKCIPGSQIMREMIRMKVNKTNMVFGFISDQHPLPGHQGYITTFLNHPTSIINGTEAIAQRLDMRVGYFDIRKVKRGHYVCTLQPMFDHAKGTAKDEITDRYTRMLEQIIQEEPAYWLWTHNRWKRKVELPTENQES